jgi:uncharacterized protein (TIGR03435 family)
VGLSAVVDARRDPVHTNAGSPSPPPFDTPDIFTAFQLQRGLKLVPTKALVEVIVIDHVEKPSAN